MTGVHMAPKSLDAQPKTSMQRFLDDVERVGNMVPHPVVIFLVLIGIVIMLSAVLSLFGAAISFKSIRLRRKPISN